MVYDGSKISSFIRNLAPATGFIYAIIAFIGCALLYKLFFTSSKDSSNKKEPIKEKDIFEKHLNDNFYEPKYNKNVSKTSQILGAHEGISGDSYASRIISPGEIVPLSTQAYPSQSIKDTNERYNKQFMTAEYVPPTAAGDPLVRGLGNGWILGGKYIRTNKDISSGGYSIGEGFPQLPRGLKTDDYFVPQFGNSGFKYPNPGNPNPSNTPRANGISITSVNEFVPGRPLYTSGDGWEKIGITFPVDKKESEILNLFRRPIDPSREMWEYNVQDKNGFLIRLDGINYIENGDEIMIPAKEKYGKFKINMYNQNKFIIQ